MNRSQHTKQVKMGCGGKTKRKRMAKGGQCKGGGAARRGKRFTRNG